MALPRKIARFNARYTNRFVEPLVRRLPGFITVHHRGRRTGARYRTPLYAFDAGDAHGADEVVVVLTYGPSADWLRNVTASGGEVARRNTVQPIEAVQHIQHDSAPGDVPRLVQHVLSVCGVSDFARIRLGKSPSDG